MRKRTDDTMLNHYFHAYFQKEISKGNVN